MPITGPRLRTCRAGGSPLPRDFAEAKQLMADAGFADGLSGVEFRGRDEAGSREALTVMQGLMRQVLGIETNLVLANLGIHYEKMNLGEFDLAETGAAMPLPIAHLYLGDLLRTDAPRNWSGYSNPDFDKLLDAMDAELDPVKYGQQVQQLLDILDRDLPLLIWGHTWNVIGWKNHVKRQSTEQHYYYHDWGPHSIWFLLAGQLGPWVESRNLSGNATTAVAKNPRGREHLPPRGGFLAPVASDPLCDANGAWDRKQIAMTTVKAKNTPDPNPNAQMVEIPKAHPNGVPRKSGTISHRRMKTGCAISRGNNRSPISTGGGVKSDGNEGQVGSAGG